MAARSRSYVCRYTPVLKSDFAFMQYVSGSPVVDPVLERQQSARAHGSDCNVARQGGRTCEMIDRPVAFCRALSPRHTRAARTRVTLQGGRDGRFAIVLGFGETFGQHRGILDRHSRALRGKRQHSVRRVAEQGNRAFGPVPPGRHREQREFSPAVHRCDHHPRRTGPSRGGEHVSEFIALSDLIPARPVPGPPNHRYDVDLTPARDGISDQMSVRAHPDLDATRGIFARQLGCFDRSAPGDQARELWLHMRKQVISDRGPDSVGADQCRRQILLTRRAAALDDGQSLGMAGDIFELAAEPQLNVVMRLGLGVQRRLQITAMHDQIRRAGAKGGGFTERETRYLTSAAHAHQADRFGRDRFACKARLQSEFGQHAAGIRREVAAGADLFKSVGFLKNDDPKTSCRECQGRRQSPDPGTGDEDGTRRRHRTAGSGGLVLDDAFRRPRFAGLQVRGESKKSRTIRADDLIVVAEIEEDIRVIEWRIGAYTHEFLRADLDNRYAGIVMKVRNDMVGHYIHLAWQWSRRHSTRRSSIERCAPYWPILLIPSAPTRPFAHANSTQYCRPREALLSSGPLCLKNGAPFLGKAKTPGFHETVANRIGWYGGLRLRVGLTLAARA